MTQRTNVPGTVTVHRLDLGFFVRPTRTMPPARRTMKERSRSVMPSAA
ncbi:hypothetical protein ACFXA0_00845 [Streptomyces cyaneofuscatus]|nr:hypothetical protein [Streptomyces sp. SID2119]MYW30754.1 hypothetical protein [Streptomyces sp. SID2119]